jgi:acyl-homoserine-lactone acylase
MGDDLREACETLARWDLTENLDSPGALLFRRFVERAGTDAANFATSFDPADPLGTPRGLRVTPEVETALRRAVADLQNSRIPLGATLRAYQYNVKRDGSKPVPIPGGPEVTGQYNVIDSGESHANPRGPAGWQPGVGYPDVNNGSSYIFWVEYTDAGPRGRSVLTNSVSNVPGSPHFIDQTELFSQKKYKEMQWSERNILADPNLVVERLCVTAKGTPCK